MSFREQYSRQVIDQSDIDAVVSCLRSDFLTQGPAVSQFESTLERRLNGATCVAVSNGTAALHLAFKALNIGTGDLVWTSPITFVATANAALYLGATVDFVDVDPRTWTIDVDRLELELTERRRAGGPLPKLLVVVHLAGVAHKLPEIRRVCDDFQIKIVEDAAHALGATYTHEGETILVGECRHSDACTFSFHPVKPITTGEGGMISFAERSSAERAREIRSHGITRDTKRFTKKPGGPWHYEMYDLGYNYRMSDIQASLGISQLSKLGALRDQRDQIVHQYRNSIPEQGFRWQNIPPESQSAHHLNIILLDDNATRSRLVQQLRERGIGFNLHYMPVYLHPFYQSLGQNFMRCPVADDYYQRALTLPLHPFLDDEDMQSIRSVLSSI